MTKRTLLIGTLASLLANAAAASHFLVLEPTAKSTDYKLPAPNSRGRLELKGGDLLITIDGRHIHLPTELDRVAGRLSLEGAVFAKDGDPGNSSLYVLIPCGVDPSGTAALARLTIKSYAVVHTDIQECENGE